MPQESQFGVGGVGWSNSLILTTFVWFLFQINPPCQRDHPSFRGLVSITGWSVGKGREGEDAAAASLSLQQTTGWKVGGRQELRRLREGKMISSYKMFLKW
jgi:hypothetical protein